MVRLLQTLPPASHHDSLSPSFLAGAGPAPVAMERMSFPWQLPQSSKTTRGTRRRRDADDGMTGVRPLTPGPRAWGLSAAVDSPFWVKVGTGGDGHGGRQRGWEAGDLEPNSRM